MTCVVIVTYMLIGKAEPASYISSTPNKHSNIHSTGNCSHHYASASIACPRGELLLDGVKQINLEDGVTDSDVLKFYAWRYDYYYYYYAYDYTHDDRVFVTLKFPNNAIKPTKVAVYCLESSQLDAGGPKRIMLHSSSTCTGSRILGVEVNSMTISTYASEDFVYRIQRYDVIIPEGSQVILNYLCISLQFNARHNWLYISEVEVYHMLESSKLLNLLQCITID